MAAELVLGRVRICGVENDQRLAFGDMDASGCSGQLQGIFGTQPSAGAAALDDVDSILRKKLLRFDTGTSPVAVVVPVDGLSHGVPLGPGDDIADPALAGLAAARFSKDAVAFAVGIRTFPMYFDTAESRLTKQFLDLR